MIHVTLKDFEPEGEKTRNLLHIAPNAEGKKRIQTDFKTILHEQLAKVLNADKVTQTLLITDPYLFNCWESDRWYPPFLEQVLAPLYAQVQQIIVLVEAGKCKTHLVRHFKQHAQTQGCQLRVFTCEHYHDRIWLSSATKQAIYIGNSLTGIGKKYTFINPLPKEDAEVAYELLKPFLNPDARLQRAEV
jgi:hypothetical protein